MQGVSRDGVVACGVRLEIVKLHVQGVKVVDEGIPDPVVDGVIVLTGIDDKCPVAVEVQTREAWKGVAACREIKREMLQNGSFALQQMAVLHGRFEGCQDDVIRENTVKLLLKESFQSISQN